MPMTITEKILARHVGREQVRPGEFIYADVDIALGNDITAPLAIREFERAGIVVPDQDTWAFSVVPLPTP